MQALSISGNSRSYQHKSSSFTCRDSSRPNYYKLLSLESQNVSSDAIKKSYRSLVLRYHPDVCPPTRKEECTRMFVELQKAYEILSDPLLREKYDCWLESEEKRGRKFQREVWADQLDGLRARSNQRVVKRNSGRGV